MSSQKHLHMTYRDALHVLDLGDDNTAREMLKIQYRWLVWFYHPDNQDTGDSEEFRKVIDAYGIVKTLWKVL